MLEQENKTAKISFNQMKCRLPPLHWCSPSFFVVFFCFFWGGRKAASHSDCSVISREMPTVKIMEMHFGLVTTNVTQNPLKWDRTSESHESVINRIWKAIRIWGDVTFFTPSDHLWVSTPCWRHAPGFLFFLAPIMPQRSSDDCKGKYWFPLKFVTKRRARGQGEGIC